MPPKPLSDSPAAAAARRRRAEARQKIKAAQAATTTVPKTAPTPAQAPPEREEAPLPFGPQEPAPSQAPVLASYRTLLTETKGRLELLQELLHELGQAESRLEAGRNNAAHVQSGLRIAQEVVSAQDTEGNPAFAAVSAALKAKDAAIAADILKNQHQSEGLRAFRNGLEIKAQAALKVKVQGEAAIKALQEGRQPESPRPAGVHPGGGLASERKLRQSDVPSS
jgi:hypothetical protein